MPTNMTNVAAQFWGNFRMCHKTSGVDPENSSLGEYIPLKYVSDDPTPDHPPYSPKIFRGVDRFSPARHAKRMIVTFGPYYNSERPADATPDYFRSTGLPTLDSRPRRMYLQPFQKYWRGVPKFEKYVT